MKPCLEAEIVGLIGEAATVALVEEFGGMRLYFPPSVDEDHRIARAIGLEAAQALSRIYSPDYIRVPLARALRARHYRAQGMSNGKIAHRLGITEPGVNILFRRLKTSPKP